MLIIKNDKKKRISLRIITEKKIFEILSESFRWIDISRVADKLNPKLTKISKYITMDKLKLINPYFSGPKTRTK